MRFTATLATLALALALAGCSKGLDRKLTTDAGPGHYAATLAQIDPELNAEERDAFHWAISDFDLRKLHTLYPNATLRTVIRGEVARGLQTWTQELTQLQQQIPEYDKRIKDLKQLRAEDAAFTLERDGQGLRPVITAQVKNGSRFAVSSLKWTATLHLDDRPDAVATAEVYDVYDNAAIDDAPRPGFQRTSTSASSPKATGLEPSSSQERSFVVGFVTGDPAWTTLAVQRARVHTVTLTPVLPSVKDYDNRAVLAGAPHQEIAKLEKNIALAQRFQKF